MKEQRILIVSDTHGSNNVVAKLIDKIKPNLTVCAGDSDNDQKFIKKYFDYFALGDNEITKLPKFKKMVKGDFWEKKIYEEFFNQAQYFKFGNKNFMLTHYYSVKNPIKTLQKKYKQAIKDKKIDYIISGHTHVPYITNLYYGYTIMNPGSIHKPRDVDAGKTYILGIYKNNKINFKICKVS